MSLLQTYNDAVKVAVEQQAILDTDEVTLPFEHGFKDAAQANSVLSTALKLGEQIVANAEAIAIDAVPSEAVKMSGREGTIMNMSFRASVRAQSSYANVNPLAKPLIHAAIDVAAAVFEKQTGHAPSLDFVKR